MLFNAKSTLNLSNFQRNAKLYISVTRYVHSEFEWLLAISELFKGVKSVK